MVEINTKTEQFFTYSAKALQSKIIKMQYWLDGYAICANDGHYLRYIMPNAALFACNENVFPCDSLSPVQDKGTLDLINIFKATQLSLVNTGLHLVSCTINECTKCVIGDFILFDIGSQCYISVPATQLHELYGKPFISPVQENSNNLSCPYHLFTRGDYNE